jgi:hypothetical protein
MPKDEFDFDDPFELNGASFLTAEDTTDAMAETFVEEFLRMGYGPRQILDLFRNAFYLGPNLALQQRGEPAIRELIADVFARWGKTVTWRDSDTEPAARSRASAHDAPVPSAGDSGNGSCAATDVLGAPIPKVIR